MQIAVIGAGNMGCVCGGNLARIGEQVTLIDVWEEHIGFIALSHRDPIPAHDSFAESIVV